ncbi:hypothetical protein [Accumulibacter sp.]|uniref:alpha/beta hydrolase family protein n=1 Tax=Accumulibacter sp. TaxID=2053492 RepID=UPI002614DBB7|nr:hypothetical protein [Accumulibacter sp.]
MNGQRAIERANALLPGRLTLPADALALVLLAHAGATPEAGGDALASELGKAGLGSLKVDLLRDSEERFADLHHNVTLLARRLLDDLKSITWRMFLGELPTLPIGLCAAGDCSPVALRVAALRDKDVFAVVCRSGLIDLAGTLYLRSLTAPLLVFVADDDERVVASNRRALRELSCRKELMLLPSGGEVSDPVTVGQCLARETTRWFVRNLPIRTA